MNAIVETTVLVDLLRNHPPAIAWYSAQTQAALGITPIIWMEVIGGGQTKAKRLQAAKMLRQFGMVYLTQVDFDWAMQAQMRYELSHGVGMMDCLIASVSHQLQLPLFAHNLKHFQPLLGNLAQAPY